MNQNLLFRRIPKVDLLLGREEIQSLIPLYGRCRVTEAVQEETDKLREELRAEIEKAEKRESLRKGESGRAEPSEAEKEAEAALERSLSERIEKLPERIRIFLEELFRPGLRRVINGSGTILHTNLGRAPIERRIAERLADLVSSYSNLEYRLSEGRRGERYSHFEKLLCRLSGAEAAMAVNNNAAAVLLILSTLASGGEVITSRGELVEIGGKFRIPDVCAQSGARLVEIGCTNKTHLSDYEEALNENTKAILKVHSSNYALVGFTESVSAASLKPLAEKHGLPLIEDLGSGVLLDLGRYGRMHEPTVQEAVRNGVDVVSFSGDKLLGGPQAGIIVGKKCFIDRMKKHPLTRAVRIDKFTVAALELTLLEYLKEEGIEERIPTLRMIAETEEKVSERAERLLSMLLGSCRGAELSTLPCESQVGGGSLPLEELKSRALCIRPLSMSITALEERLRGLPLPIIGRVAEERLLLDLRTISDAELPELAEELKEVIG